MKRKPIQAGAASAHRRHKVARWTAALAATSMLAGGLTAAKAELVHHGIAAGLIGVSQIPDLPPANDNFQFELLLSINDFRQVGGNQGDYDLTIGSTRTDDVDNGVVIPTVAENGSDPWGTNQFGGASIAFTTNATLGESYWRIASQAGTTEYNTDVAGAYFPYARYLGGYVRNATLANGATNDTFTGSPGLVLGTHVYGVANGRSVVDLTSLGIDSRTDGILLVTHAKDENNWALSSVNTTNGSWNVAVKDLNSASAGSVEQDPFAFVYIPKSDTNLVSGRFQGNGTILLHSGNTPQFTITPLSGGRWELKVAGHTPDTGVLILSHEGGFGQNQDNILSYEINAARDGWEIQSRDTPGNGLQTPGGGDEPVASFVFIPAATPGFTVEPTNNLLTTESGGTATFTVALHNLPKGDVTINVSSSNEAEGTVSPSVLTFTAANWNIPQTVTITGVDDGATDGPVSYNVVLFAATSSDAAYNGLNPADVSVINADNEAGVTVSASRLTTTEAGGTATFSVRLNTAPSSDVVVELSSNDVSEGTVSPANLFFTAANWNQPQTVTVTGVNDAIDDGDITYTIVTAAALSGDPAYNGAAVSDVTVVNLDNDTAGIVTTPSSGLSVQETGSTSNFTLVLTSEPTANVTVNLASTDLSEGTVSPATLTFTPANWMTPQQAAVTGVNDTENDGNSSYAVNITVTSGDALYAALQQSISATTVDNEAALTLPSGTLVYSIGTPGTAIDSMATVIDADTVNYGGGSITVSLTANGAADDRVEIRASGNGTNQITVAGNTVSYAGTAIGTFSGGSGTAPLVVTLNGAATPVSAQALLRSITFHNVNSSSPSLATRTLRVALADGVGGTSVATKDIQIRLMRTFNFQEGVDHGFGAYSGGADIELNGVQPDTAFPAGSSVDGLWVAWEQGIQNRNVLFRFDNIFGNGPTQIPTNAIIVSADLILYAANAGDGSPLHRMLQPWDATNATWNSVGGGILFDDVQARSTYDSQIGVADLSGATTVGHITVSVTPDVQAWANGEPNYGWVMAGWPFNGDGTGFAPTEATNATQRPHLRVKWLPAGTASVSFRQGVNGYTGVRDTRVGEDAMDMDFSTATTIFVDGEINAGEADQAQGLLRFNDIIGNAAGQIPAGATIHAAVLDLASLGNNAMGDGGRFHALLKPWEDTTSTWNSWGTGIQLDNVEAVSMPTAVAGNATLNPDVQGGYLTFELTSDVQAWVNNVRPNYGWAIMPWPLGGNGWGIGMSESVNERERPQLRVYYSPGTGNVAINMLTPTVTPTSVTVRFTGGIGSTYTVLRSATVNGPYSSIGTATVQGNGTATFNDNAPLSGTAFYRISNP